MGSSNRIVEKYFADNTFSKNVQRITREIVNDTGFVIEKEIFRGFIYNKEKLGSVIYKGIYNAKPAVLKIQGLRPDTDEIDIIEDFNKQNKSSKVRLPQLFAAMRYDKAKQYGYLITEFIDAPHIFQMPYANEVEKRDFCNFYQEYRNKTVNQPFVKNYGNETSSQFVIRRAKNWKKVALDRKNILKRLTIDRLVSMLEIYNEIMQSELTISKMVFCHGHLTANDIFKQQDKYILLSNLYWSYRPELYDLVFGLHWCIENIQDKDVTYDKLEKFIKDWIDNFYDIPVVKLDKNGKQKLHLMLLERTFGGVLLDTGSQDLSNISANQLFPLQLRLFENLIKRIQAHDYI